MSAARRRILEDIALIVFFFIVVYTLSYIVVSQALKAPPEISSLTSMLVSSPIFALLLMLGGIAALGAGVKMAVSAWEVEHISVVGVALAFLGALFIIISIAAIVQQTSTLSVVYLERIIPSTLTPPSPTPPAAPRP